MFKVEEQPCDLCGMSTGIQCPVCGSPSCEVCDHLVEHKGIKICPQCKENDITGEFTISVIKE